MNGILTTAVIKLDTLGSSGRVLIGVIVLVLIFIMWNSFIRIPMSNKTLKLENEISKTKNDINTLNAKLGSAKILHEQAPNTKIGADKASLTFDLAKLNEELDQLTVEFIPSTLMTKILEEMFANGKDMELTRMQNITSTPLVIDESNAGKKNGKVIYRHGVVIEFKGKYLSTLNYLKTLENMKWKFYWGGLKYTVDEYPYAHITITLYTLSLDEGWVGV